MYDFMFELKVGLRVAYVPMCDGIPMGLTHGQRLNRQELVGHLMFFKKFWGEMASEGLKKCIEFGLEDTGTKRILGYPPVANIRCRTFLKRNGFKSEGILPSEFVREGKQEDVEILTWEKDNG